MSCNNITTTQGYLVGDDPLVVDFGCMPSGVGAPTEAPNPDEIPFYFDTREEVLYYYTCYPEMWTKVHSSISDLDPVDISKLPNPSENLKVPVTYKVGNTIVEGLVPLGDLIKSILANDGEDPVLAIERNDDGDIVATHASGKKSIIEQGLQELLDKLPPEKFISKQTVTGNKLISTYNTGDTIEVELPDLGVDYVKKTDGKSTNQTLTTPTINGAITLDEAAIASLCEALKACAPTPPEGLRFSVTGAGGDNKYPNTKVHIDGKSTYTIYKVVNGEFIEFLSGTTGTTGTESVTLPTSDYRNGRVEYLVQTDSPSVSIENQKPDDTYSDLDVDLIDFYTAQNSVRLWVDSNLTVLPTQLPKTITKTERMFRRAKQFNQDITGWDISHVTDTSYMFSEAKAFNQPIGKWDTSNVTNMSYMFHDAASFNKDLSLWDTSNVTDMSSMFRKATSFNQYISSWDTSNVTDMSYMFYTATSYNKDLSLWDTSNVTNMNNTFGGASSFNGDISTWDTSNVTNMSATFSGATSFNGDISKWDTSSVTGMGSMFSVASSFNGDISKWDTSNVTSMISMFYNATSFNGDISLWDTSNVTNMSGMFSGATSFIRDISTLDTSSVTDMSDMFNRTIAYNKDISTWDTSNVTNMSGMFSKATAFNQDISTWDTSNVTKMGSMFNGATAFNQDLSSWCVTKINNLPDSFDANTPNWTLPKPVWGTCP